MYYRRAPYRDSLHTALSSGIGLEKLKNRSVLITGASGLVGSFIVDLLMYGNEQKGFGTRVVASGRDINKLRRRFVSHEGSQKLCYLDQDVSVAFRQDIDCDFIIHAAANANPMLFSSNPVDTIISSITGTFHVLNAAFTAGIQRVLYVSSGEVYGQPSEDMPAFSEEHSGYVDISNPRSCYPMSKRACETLLAAYLQQYGLDYVVVRPCHIYGANITKNDDRVTAQFFQNVIDGKDILLKSQGLQLRSYCHVADCASGLLTALCAGEKGQAYNIANPNSNVTIREFAHITARCAGRQVCFTTPSGQEKRGYNPVLRSVLDGHRLLSLGWIPDYDIYSGIENVLNTLQYPGKPEEA